MMFMPFNILGIWFRGLLAVAIIAAGVYLVSRWYDESHVLVPVAAADEAPAPDGRPADRPMRRVFRFDPGMNRETALLAGGAGLLAIAAAGSILRRAASGMMGGPRPATNAAEEDPREERPGTAHRIARPDGSELQVETYGDADAPPIIMTHGWGCNSTEWFYARKALARRFRVIVWDEPGLGLSAKPSNNDFSMEKLARDLEAVLEFAGPRPAVLVGHSIGGMIALTLCKIAPALMAGPIAGLVLVHTTYTNPVRTTKMAWFYTAIEKPVIIPLLYATIALWPLVWVMNWLSYLNGSVHRSTHKQSFAGHETRGQLDFFARMAPHARPDVLARGMLGMIGYDATPALPSVTVPTLVVIGDQDTTTLPEAGQFIARGVRKGRLESLAPAKHLGLIELHPRFDALVDEFAATCLGAAVDR